MPRLTPLAKTLLPAAILALVPATLRAQALADRVPADAVLYVGWAGGASQADAYGQSNLKTVIAASGLPETAKTVVPQLLDKLAASDPEQADALRLIYSVAETSWGHPSAFIFEGVDFRQDGPVPKLTTLIDAGADAAAVKGKIDQLLAQANADQSPVPVRTFSVGGIVGVTVGHPAGEMAMAGPGGNRPDALAADAAFTGAMANVMKNPAVAVYLDHDKLLNIVDQTVTMAAPPENAAAWKRFRNASGLTGFHRAVITAGFDGKDWREKAFLAAPSPRTGLLGLLEAEPFGEDLLKSVPADATRVFGLQFDAEKLLNTAVDITRRTDPEAGDQFANFLGQVDQMIGGSLQNDVLAPLGNRWVAYTAPTVGGDGTLGIVVINQLDDPEKAAAGIQKLATAINRTVGNLTRRTVVRVAGRSAPAGDGGTTVYYLGTPLVTPAFAVKGNHLFLGLYPQTVQSAIAAADAAESGKAAPGEDVVGIEAGGSILDNPRFAAVRKRLAEQPTASFTYLDTPALADGGYQFLLAYSRLLVGGADMFRVLGDGMPGEQRNPNAKPMTTAVPLLMPPLRVVMGALAPEGSTAWVDADGLHSDTVSSFPGSAIFTSDPSLTAIGQQATMVSILLPSLNRARGSADRIRSGANLRQIGMGLLLYSNENGNQYPPDLATVMRTQDLAPAVMDSPLGDAPGGDYVYLYYPELTPTAGAEIILAYDAAAWQQGEGTNVLFGDGHVEWVQPADFGQAVARSRASDPKSCPADKLPADMPPATPPQFR